MYKDHFDKRAEREYREMRKQIEAERRLAAQNSNIPKEPPKKRIRITKYPVRRKHSGGFTHVITSRYEDAPVKYSILAGDIPKGYTVIFQCQIGEVLPKFYWKLESYHEKYNEEDSRPSKVVTRKRCIIGKSQLRGTSVGEAT